MKLLGTSLIFLVTTMVQAEITVKSVTGTVKVRRGVSQEWKLVHSTDLLKLEDTILTEAKSTVTIVMGEQQITIPPLTNVDLVDFRILSQEEFLLQLAMEDVLRVPLRRRDNLTVPATTIIHGGRITVEPDGPFPEGAGGTMKLRGTKVLFDHGYYATGVLRTKEILRSFKDVPQSQEARFRMAVAFEKLGLEREALQEYVSLSSEGLTDELLAKTEAAIERLKKK